MTRRIRLICSLGTLAGLVSAGCSNSSSTSAPTTNQLEIFSWFTSGSEQAGLQALLQDVSQQHSDIPYANIVNAAQADPHKRPGSPRHDADGGGQSA